MKKGTIRDTIATETMMSKTNQIITDHHQSTRLHHVVKKKTLKCLFKKKKKTKKNTKNYRKTRALTTSHSLFHFPIIALCFPY